MKMFGIITSSMIKGRASIMANNVYQESMALTRSCTVCPNPFRVDMYKGCDFGCKYCFANMHIFKPNEFKEADIEKLQRKFKVALETDKKRKDVIIELLRNRVPIHCGGMSDPFQEREYERKLTYKLIELSNKYDYPICFSTKTAKLPESYLMILNPKIHAFQSSIMGFTESYIRKWEKNTPSAESRVAFVKEMRDLGFWHSIRIQPIIDIIEVLSLLDYVFRVTTPSYVTVEHLKIINDNKEALNAYRQYCSNKADFWYTSSKKLECRQNIKIHNIESIQELCNKHGVLVGVGDNDLHYMTQSRNCCGIDTAGEAFENYLKYNVTYMSTGAYNVSDMFIPQCNCRKHINDQKFGNYIDFKEYVDAYMQRHKLKARSLF